MLPGYSILFPVSGLGRDDHPASEHFKKPPAANARNYATRQNSAPEGDNFENQAFVNGWNRPQRECVCSNESSNNFSRRGRKSDVYLPSERSEPQRARR